ncbi:MAG: helix-turn-helix domain-containing protein [Gemmatimonadaceae bacterium]
MIVRTAKELGALVRDHRTGKGLTQAQLAARVGASRKWIIDLEGGKRTADLSMVLRALNALGVELDAHARTTRHRQDAVDIDELIAVSQRSRR